MGILKRAADIMKANVNDLLDKAEDPAKMIDQTLRDLRNDLAKVKKETAEVMANEKRDKRLLDECEADITKTTTAAQNAVKAGNDEDAKKLIARKQQLEANKVNLQKNYDVSKANSDKMKQMHDKLVSDINILEGKAATIKATVANAEARKHVNEINNSVDASKGIAAFNKYEEKANKMLDEAEAMNELNDSAKEAKTENLVEKYSSSSNSQSVDDELAKMKEELGM